jgi:hypothetical protein
MESKSQEDTIKTDKMTMMIISTSQMTRTGTFFRGPAGFAVSRDSMFS